MTETGATRFGAQIKNLVLVVDGISALGLSILVDLLALAFLAFEFEGLLILACTLDIANGRASLEDDLLLAEFLLLLFLEGLQVSARSFLLLNFKGFVGVGA